MITLFLLSSLLELLFYQSLWWRSRSYVQYLVLLYSTATTLMLALVVQPLLAAFILFVGVYRVVNLLRVIVGRSHEGYLLIHARRASLFLIGAQLLAVAFTEIQLRYFPLLQGSRLLLLLALVQLATGMVVLRSVRRSVNKMDVGDDGERFTDADLPTVTVAIPARNETPSLQACIEAVISNDYPKLEVLVLDDCSQDKTSDIIKGYAQAGVRFIKGKEPEEKWIAKNQAYQQLLEHATGEIIVFCGVDVRLGPTTIRHLITTMLSRSKQMVVVLPRHNHVSFSGALLQPMRYWWELALPRRLFNRPAVLSTCWAIKRASLNGLGGFKAVSRAVIPEGYFARELVKVDGYSFVRNSEVLEVTTEKEVADQYDRAVRYRYPEVHRRLELVAALTFIELLLLLAPFVLVPFAVFTGNPLLGIVSFAAVVELIVASCLILSISSRLQLGTALINFPFMVITEIVMGNLSLFKYEFMTVDWKGRNICLPVMHSEKSFSQNPSLRSKKHRQRHKREREMSSGQPATDLFEAHPKDHKELSYHSRSQQRHLSRREKHQWRKRRHNRRRHHHRKYHDWYR